MRRRPRAALFCTIAGDRLQGEAGRPPRARALEPVFRRRRVDPGGNVRHEPALRPRLRLGFEAYGTGREVHLVDGDLHPEHRMVCRLHGLTPGPAA